MNRGKSPADILETAYQKAISEHGFTDDDVSAGIDRVCRSSIGAGVRLLLACGLAKVHDPSIDIRKPFTESGEGSYSGRSYDEHFITTFIDLHELPCNSTTAFLTPALRTKGGIVLQRGTDLGGRRQGPYETVITLINDVHEGRLAAEDMLTETIRKLLLIKRERAERISSLLSEVKRSSEEIQLSAEDIVSLITQHLKQKHAARLPVLVVAAAYTAASNKLGERILPLYPHTAADERTGALGDVEITLMDDDQVITTYEMKTKKVTKDDVNRAVQKINHLGEIVDHYVFITTDEIDATVAEYAASLYAQLGGIEIAILDCIGFLRHFLHLFHRLRLEFLDSYQVLLLDEPQSAVRDEIKEVFLTLRRAAESGYSITPD